jgi:hypothetical protein
VVETNPGIDFITDFAKDKNGASRTIPWSMGAFELD